MYFGLRGAVPVPGELGIPLSPAVGAPGSAWAGGLAAGGGFPLISGVREDFPSSPAVSKLRGMEQRGLVIVIFYSAPDSVAAAAVSSAEK